MASSEQQGVGGFLAGVSAPAREAFLQRARLVELRTGQPVFLQGDPSWMVGLVRKGHLKLTSVSPAGRSHLIRLWGPGDLFGQMTAMTGLPQVGTASALYPSELLTMSVGEFQQLLAQFPELNRPLIHSLLEWVNLAVSAQCSQAYEAVAQRLARMLLTVSGSCTDVSVEAETTIPLTQQDLADAIGASREATARVLKRFRTLGIIETQRHHIRINSLSDLRRIACDGTPVSEGSVDLSGGTLAGRPEAAAQPRRRHDDIVFAPAPQYLTALR